MRNRINLHTIRDDSLLGTLKFVAKTEDYQKYRALIPDDTSKGTSVKLRVPNVSKEDSSDSEAESLGDSKEESDDDNDEDENDDDNEEDDSDNDDGGNDDGGNDDEGNDDEGSNEDSDQTDSYDDENPSFTLKDYEEEEEYEEFMLTLERNKSDDDYKMYEEEDDDVTKEEDQQNASHKSGFVQEEEDAHVTLTTAHDKTEVRLQSNKLKEEAEAENQEFINQVNSTMKKIIKKQVKAQVSKIMPQIKDYVTESLEDEVLVRSTNQPHTSYAVAASLSEFDLKKILIDKIKTNESIKKSDIQRNLYNALIESYNTDKDILSTNGDVVTLKRGGDDQDKDEDPFAGCKDVKPSKGSKSKESKSSSFSKGTQSHHKSYECYKAINDRLDWHNLEGNEYPFDLRKPLPLIEDQGRQVVPADYFINNDLEYLKGRSLSRKYVNSTTRTKAAKYDNIEGIEDMVPTLWSPVKVAYNKHVVWGTYHWGPK
nr:hypothetical protein [Tanacetum cinerariifolium]